MSWIPRAILERLGAPVVSRLPFTLADGRELEKETTAVLLTIDGRRAAVQVAFGEPGEEPVLGATALEGLGCWWIHWRRNFFLAIYLRFREVKLLEAGSN
ncbi:MAG TPA: hypothetical protein VKV95_19255 [Terriglobia bacterium]|nr:hypothetical protein [Terriglobia bacterium]